MLHTLVVKSNEHLGNNYFQWYYWRDFFFSIYRVRKTTKLFRLRKTAKGLPWWLSGKEFTCQWRRLGLIPELGRSLGEGNSNSFQYSCLGNPMDRGAWQATVRGITKKLILLSDWITTTRLSKQACFCSGSPSQTLSSTELI